MSGATVAGPAWAERELKVSAGRFPLSVEGHLTARTRELVPGATTVTTGARYYTLHTRVAIEARRRDLDDQAFLDLLRRCEVVVSGASHMSPDTRLPAAHGLGPVGQILDQTGELPVEHLAAPGRYRYTESEQGYIGPYIASERLLGLLDPHDYRPGPRAEELPLDQGFLGLFDLALSSVVTASDLAGVPHLAVGAASTTADGMWLGRLLCGLVDDPTRADVVRRNTVRTLARAVSLAANPAAVSAMRQAVAYGDLLTEDEILHAIPEAEIWRGTLYRHHAIGAWRALWARMVDHITRPMPRSEVADFVVSCLPPGTVGSFLSGLPPPLDQAGHPLPAELSVNADSDARTVARCLSTIAIGGLRSAQVTGRVRFGFVGNGNKVLGPEWVHDWLDERTGRQVTDVAAELVDVIFDRANRIAVGKMTVRPGGHVWIPSVIDEVGGLLHRVGRDSARNVGTRLEQLAGLLTAVGVLDTSDEMDPLTDRGREWLGLP